MEAIVLLVAGIVAAIIGAVFYSAFWTFVCVFRTLVGLLFPSRTCQVSRWQLVALTLLLIGLATEAVAALGLFVFQVSWTICVPVFGSGLALLTFAASIASHIERTCLDAKRQTSIHSEPAEDAKTLPWTDPQQPS